MDRTPTIEQQSRFSGLIAQLEEIKNDLNAFNKDWKAKHGTAHFKAYNLSSEIYQKIQFYKGVFARKFADKEEVLRKLNDSVKYYKETADRVKKERPITAL